MHLKGDILLGKNVNLTIKPGTTIYIASNSDISQSGMANLDEVIRGANDPVGLAEWDKNAILIDGRGGIIQAVGTPEEPITFRPEGESTSPGQWYGIFIERGTLQYATVLYGGRTAIQALGSYGDIEIAHNVVRYAHWAGIASFAKNVWIHHNTVEGGGHQAIVLGLNDIAEHNIVTNAQTGIAIENGDGSIVRNNLILDCTEGIGLRSGQDVGIFNNTISWISGPPDGWYYQGNLIYPAFKMSAGINNYLTTPKIIVLNNIIYGPFDWGLGMHQQPGNESVFDYNLVWNTKEPAAGSGVHFPGVNNIVVDPLFVNPVTLDFHLLPGSPAINAGDPGIFNTDGTRSDMGAYGGMQGTGW